MYFLEKHLPISVLKRELKPLKKIDKYERLRSKQIYSALKEANKTFFVALSKPFIILYSLLNDFSTLRKYVSFRLKK